MSEEKVVEWKINVDRFSEFSFIKDEIDLLIINNVIDKTYVNINDLFEYIDLYSKTKVSLKKVKNKFEYLIGQLKFTTMWRGLNYPDETKVKDLYLIRQNEDSWKQKYLIDNNKFNYHLVYENDEVSETITSNIELEEGSKFIYKGLDFEVTNKLNNDILAENI
jgi:hypothetical protein